jgi:transcriptional regulator with XRE-family HTH domain
LHRLVGTLDNMTATVTAFEWTLGDRLRKARRMAGLTGEELGGRLGVSKEAALAWERGTRNPSWHQVERWAQETGVPFELFRSSLDPVRNKCFSVAS